MFDSLKWASRPSRRQLLAGGISAAAVIAGAAPAFATTGGLARRISAIIPPLMQQHDIPGLAVGIVTPSGSATFPFGIASRGGKEPVTADTLFELGSVSKVYTATLAALGHARAQLDWSDAASRFLPQLRGCSAGDASLLELGAYAAGGLPLQFPADVSDYDAAMQYFRTWRPLHPFGKMRQYSNPSIGLFGCAAASAMGGDFQNLMMSDLLPGLGLNDTYLSVPAGAEDRYAWGHDGEGSPVRVNPGVLDAEAYGIKSTLRDVMRLVQLNIDSSALSEDFRHAIGETHVPRFQVGPMIQGSGWEIYAAPHALTTLIEGNSRAMIFQAQPARRLQDESALRGSLLNKTGSTGGFGAYVLVVPDARVGVVILANRNFPIQARIKAAFAILQEIAPR